MIFQSDPTTFHKYEKSGEYQVSVRIQDFPGNWRESDDCKVTIKVNATPQVLGAVTTDSLPAAGASAITVLVGMLLFAGGRFLIKRFKLV